MRATEPVASAAAAALHHRVRRVLQLQEQPQAPAVVTHTYIHIIHLHLITVSCLPYRAFSLGNTVVKGTFGPAKKNYDIHVCRCMHVCMHVCMYVYVRVDVSVSMYVCMYVDATYSFGLTFLIQATYFEN